MPDTDVLIVGAGPTGLVLALWLTKLGVSVRVIDKTSAPGTTSRALAVHARTLELYQQLDLADAVVAKGYTVPGVRLWLRGQQVARVPFEKLVSGFTPYGFLHIFPQDEHERLLVERLQTMGVSVERSVELLDYSEASEGVAARLREADGGEKQVSARFIAGCDGARSRVRAGMGVEFLGGTYPQVFYVADVEGDGAAFNGDLDIELDDSDFLAIFPLADQGRIRLIGVVKSSTRSDLAELKFEDIEDKAAKALKLKIRKVNWFSVYHVHHRVTARFRKGRAFLLGDAAHIHTPVGGQGMNTGIGDAINLAWKLKAVVSGKAGEVLLDTFESERRAFAVRLVRTTDRFFSVAAANGPIARFMRTRVVPALMPQLMKIAAARDYIFRTISQITLNYRGRGLASGRAGRVCGGDRLPWLKTAGFDNYEPLRRMDWQVHIYGAAQSELVDYCRRQDLALHVFAWNAAFAAVGLTQDTLYLVRPDTYLALVHRTQSVAPIEALFAKIQS